MKTTDRYDTGKSKAEAAGSIVTYTGRWVTPLEMDPNDVDILDIAHSLANQCRFTGHVSKFYSVGQHSVLASYVVPDDDAFEALLHDASEAYLADIARPLKSQPGFGTAYRKAEDRIMAAIGVHFDIPATMSQSVKDADYALLRAEQRDLMPNDPPDGGDLYSKKIMPWLPVTTERKFLARYEELKQPIQRKRFQKFLDGDLKKRDYKEPFHYGETTRT